MMENYIKLYDWVLACDELNMTEKIVYSLIYQMTNSGRREGWWGGYDSMAKRLHIARRSCISAVTCLKNIKAVKEDEAPQYSKCKYALKTTKNFADFFIGKYTETTSAQNADAQNAGAKSALK